MLRASFDRSGGTTGYGRFRRLTESGRQNEKTMRSCNAQEYGSQLDRRSSIYWRQASCTSDRHGSVLLDAFTMIPLPDLVTPRNALLPCGAGVPYTVRRILNNPH